MRKHLALVVFLALAFAAMPARAESHYVVFRYALALERFNPNLDATSAMVLARATIERADDSGLDARLLVALIAVESRWNPAAISPAGARGLGQLMPQTAGGLGVDPDDPLQNIAGAARYLRFLLDAFADRDPETQYALAVAAYNAGLSAVKKYGGIPPFDETKRYVRSVITLWRRLAAR